MDKRSQIGRLLGRVSLGFFLLGIAIWVAYALQHKPIVLFASSVFRVEMVIYLGGLATAVLGLLTSRTNAHKALSLVGLLCNGAVLVAPFLLAVLLVSH
jgi:hypothetical protein